MIFQTTLSDLKYVTLVTSSKKIMNGHKFDETCLIEITPFPVKTLDHIVVIAILTTNEELLCQAITKGSVK